MAAKSITRAKHYMRPAKPFLGNSTPTLTAPEAASQSFKKGQAIKFASGKVAAAAASSRALVSVVGLAQEDASGTASTDISYVPLLPGVIYEGAVNGSASSASKYTLKATDLGHKYGLSLKSNVTYVDKSASAAATQMVMIVGLKDAASTVQGHVYFTPILNKAAGVASSVATNKDRVVLI